MNRNDKVRRVLGVFAVLSLALLLSVSCSDNNSSTDPGGGGGGEGGGGGLDVTFSRYTALVQAIAPPVYTGGGGSYYKPLAPADSTEIDPDSIWWQGEFALLGKVFGEDEPFSLYRNIDELDDLVAQCEEMLEYEEGTYTEYEDRIGDSITIVLEIDTLTAPVAIPEQCQAVLGSDSLSLDYYIGVEIDDLDLVQQTAFKVSETDEWFYTFNSMPRMEEQGGVESSLNLAYRNHQTDSIDIKSVFFKYQNNMQDTIMWVYHIQTVNTDDFNYKMSWYSDEVDDGDTTRFIGAIIGGGDKDSEFVLRYRQFDPPDADEPDSLWQSDQVFGPNYSDEGQDLSQNYLTLYPLTEMYKYDDFPTGLLTSPIDPADAMSPWGP
ncbi:MAG: hypothetical protein GF307_02740 [candidate division Zixibacteria bacterium]|nr:hypothetical protein [candidate division Zixibacteria bacterium]